MSFTTDHESMNRKERVTAVFRQPNEAEMRIDRVASEEQKRTVYIEQVMCEIRIPGDNNRRPVFPAHAVWKKENGRTITYAERFKPEYQAYLDKRAPTVRGTPIEQMPYLTMAKRAELKALSIYSIEQLSELDENAIKRLGSGGRDLKNDAIKFLASVNGGVNSIAIMNENERLKAEIEALKAQAPRHDEPVASGDRFDAMTDDELREVIRPLNGGSLPKGNHSRNSLLRLARDLSSAGVQ